MLWDGPSCGTPRGAHHHPTLSISPNQVMLNPSVSPCANQGRLRVPRCCCKCW